jgi:Polyketide cyclase / dehydrase and lipid transport
MATIRSELTTPAPASKVWSAVRDIGALHTRLVPGFVVDTRLEPGARIVTFVNGVTLREPIVTLDDEARRLVWTAEGGRARHYNAALEVASLPGGLTSVVWTADFLPDDLHAYFARAIEAGMAAMQRALDQLAA